MPAINIEPSDAQFAAMYLSFGSDILEDNQVTDYLIRVVQPRLSAIEGVQRADILGGRTFALRAWLKPERMAALERQPVAGAPGAGRQQLPVRGRPDQGRAGPAQPHRRRPTCDRVEEFKKLVHPRAERRAGAPRGRRRRGARRRRPTIRTCASPGEKAVFMGVWVLPNANSLDVIGRVRKEIDAIKQRAAHRHDRPRSPSTRPTYIDDAIDEVVKTLIETVLIVIVVIFLFLGSLRTVLVPVVAIPVSLIGAVFLMQVFGFTLNLLTLLAIVLSVGLVVDDAIVVVENVERHMREGKTPLRGGAARRARAGRADHRHDHHAGRGVRADRLPGRPHRRAVPRVRLHAGGRGVHLRRRGADALADDVVAPAARRARATGLAGRVTSSALRRGSAAATRAALAATLRVRARRSTRSGSCCRC